jgi:putative Mg2+ transporter-C (MgtC) family protein
MDKSPIVIYFMHWVTADLRTAIHTPVTPVVLALVALICGAIIGTEREKREKPAGLRTLILVCLGSAGFTMAGFAFTSNTGDSGRVAAQIVTGIGFLGAGVILHPRGTISGATTAASIWVTASVGMIAGAGYAGAALGMSLLVRFVLAVVAVYESRLFKVGPGENISLDFDPGQGKTRVHLERILVDYPLATIGTQWTSGPDGLDRLSLRVHLPRHHLRELLDDLVSVTEVKRVHQEYTHPPE